MFVGTTPERPMILPPALFNREIVDAGDAPPHEAMLVELPVLVAVGAEPVAGVVVPLVGETHGDAVAVKRPKFLDEAIVQFLAPLAGQELDNGLAAREKLSAIAPDAVRRVGQGNSLRIACVPGVLSH